MSVSRLECSGLNGLSFKSELLLCNKTVLFYCVIIFIYTFQDQKMQSASWKAAN